MEKLIERWFEIDEERKNIEKQLRETVVIELGKSLKHRFRIMSDQVVEYFDVKTGVRDTVTPPGVGMHIEEGSWKVFEGVKE